MPHPTPERPHGRDEIVETEVLILGGGLAGLAGGSLLGDRATVLEAEPRPGGLVRTERVGAYWFDHVIHLLYFSHPSVEERIRGMLGETLRPCPPVAWVETAAGTTRFPVQLHLAGLEPEARAACLTDFAEAARADRADAADYAELLLNAFGRTLCDLFFFPYNAKLWRRPLNELSASGFHWNLTRPGLAEVEHGADPARPVTAPYNARGWYPRPSGPGRRGMEVLSEALAGRVADLRLRHTVEHIDPERRLVRARTPEGPVHFHYTRECLSTLPLPTTVERCASAPADLVAACRELPRNRVRSVALAVRGPRPAGTGHWRYYTRADVPFTRLVFMTEFDPAMAPADGWGVLAEVVERSGEPAVSDAELTARVLRGVRAVGMLDEGEVVESRVFHADPGYVVFTPAAQAVTERALGFLAERGLTALGRYGSWTYSSMSQVMESAFAWAEGLGGAPAARPPAATAPAAP
ncbi:protoporphyrinogen/coproporphyrinogen oxidase [Streptomyces sp. NPDC017673]|uniref:protoporphyrinogen/coproporphyrinogen oxidase n=1 Tax=unclassified Streptomyces TaxID=2593676 RepID=UPI0037B94FE7